jgi:uncharacterized paraquat-inducible protein A
MVPVVPLVATVPLAIGVLVAILFVGIVVYTVFDDDEWSNAPRSAGGTGDAETVCPRCHHRTPANASSCPECGKSL